MYNWKNYNNKKLSLAKYFDAYNKDNLFNYVENSYYNHTRDIFCLCLLLLKNKIKKVKVLDYGSNIATLSNIKNKIETKGIDFYIFDPFFEKKKLIKLYKIKFRIIKNLSNYNKKINFLNFGSSLQYISNYKDILKKINFEKKSIILITATPFTINKTYSSLQSNHKDLIQIVNNFYELVNFLKRYNFNLVFKSSIDIDLAQIKKKNKNTFFLNLIFQKN